MRRGRSQQLTFRLEVNRLLEFFVSAIRQTACPADDLGSRDDHSNRVRLNGVDPGLDLIFIIDHSSIDDLHVSGPLGMAGYAGPLVTLSMEYGQNIG